MSDSSGESPNSISNSFGSVALVGSGEYLPEMAKLEALLIEDGVAKGKKARFVQIPTAAGQESRERIKYWQELGERQARALDVEPVFLPIFDAQSANRSEFLDAIIDGSLVYMSGGDPHFLANTLRGSLVASAIREHWQSGGSLAGCSAGAMVKSSKIPNFRMARTAPTEGLGLVPDIRVIPHFNKFFKWIPESAAKILLEVPEDAILLGIDELTALVRRVGEEQWQVFGQAKVHILKGAPRQELTHEQRTRLVSLEP